MQKKGPLSRKKTGKVIRSVVSRNWGGRIGIWGLGARGGPLKDT